MISDGMKAANRAAAIHQGGESAASRWRGRVTGRDTAPGERSIIHGPRAKKRPLLIIISCAEKQRGEPGCSRTLRDERESGWIQGEVGMVCFSCY